MSRRTAHVRVVISLHPERDRDVIDHLDSQESGTVSEYIRGLVRSDMKEAN